MNEALSLSPETRLFFDLERARRCRELIDLLFMTGR